MTKVRRKRKDRKATGTTAQQASGHWKTFSDSNRLQFIKLDFVKVVLINFVTKQGNKPIFPRVLNMFSSERVDSKGLYGR